MGKSAKKKPEVKTHLYYRYIPYILILVLGYLIYANTFNVPFQFDDEKIILNNEKVISLTSYKNIQTWLDVNKRPLAHLSLGLNYLVSGGDTYTYHLVNWIIHILNTLLVFLIINTLSKKKNLSLFVSILFLVHPLQTMAVTYIVQRMTSMSAMFFLSSFLFFIKGRLTVKKGLHWKKVILFGLSFLAFYLAVMSKQNAIVLPLILMLYEIHFTPQEKRMLSKKQLTASMVFLILVFSLAAIFGILPADTEKFTSFEYFIVQFKVLFKYFGLLLFPISQNIDHHIALSSPLIGWMEITGFLLFIGSLYLAYRYRTNNKMITFGILWFYICMLVESSFIPIRDLMMEHRMYLPIIGFGLFFYGILSELFKSRPITQNTILVVTILIFSITTFQRNKVWQSETSLWQDALRKAPGNPRALTNLGYAYSKGNQKQQAIMLYNRAIQEDPKLYESYLNRGIAYFDLADYPACIRDLSYYIENRPQNHISYFFRGTAYGHVNRAQEGIRDLTKFLKKNEKHSEAYKNRGILFMSTENYELALSDFNKALEYNPSGRKLYINRSEAHFRLGNYRKAYQDIEQARKAGYEVDRNYINYLKQLLGN